MRPRAGANRPSYGVNTARIAHRIRRAPGVTRPSLSSAGVRRAALHAACVLAAAGIAAGHLLLLLWTQDRGFQSGIVNWPVLLAPALIVLFVLPSSWRRWKRWALLYFIVFTCNPVLLPQVLLVAETAVLYSVLFRDRQPGDLHWLRSARAVLLRRFRRTTRDGSPGAAPAPAREPGKPGKAADPRAKSGPTLKRPRRGPVQARARVESR